MTHLFEFIDFQEGLPYTPAMLSAVLAAVGSAVVHPFASIYARKAAHPLTLNFWGMCGAALIFSWVYFDPSWWGRVGEHLGLVLVAMALHTGYILLSLPFTSKHAYQVVYPLSRSTPLFILVGEMVLLGAEFSWVQVVGVVLATGGVLVLGLDRKINHVRAVVAGQLLLMILLMTGIILVDKVLLQWFSPAEFWALVLIQLPLLVPIVWRHPKAAKKDLKNWKKLLAYTVAGVGSWYLALMALTVLDGAVVASIRNLSIVFGVALGGHLFNEGHAPLRYAAAGMIVLGAALAVGFF